MNTFAKFGVEAGTSEDQARLAVREAYSKIDRLQEILNANGSKYSNTILTMYKNQLADMETMLLNGMGEHETFFETHNAF